MVGLSFFPLIFTFFYIFMNYATLRNNKKDKDKILKKVHTVIQISLQINEVSFHFIEIH
jgi:hypothetical protein